MDAPPAQTQNAREEGVLAGAGRGVGLDLDRRRVKSALGVLDAVTPGDLTRGHFVAGTGTIGVDGTVGPVSGAAEKVVAAERGGAEIFLVPRENYADALLWRTSVTVVPVDHFEDAVSYLCQLAPAPGADVHPPAPCPGS